MFHAVTSSTGPDLADLLEQRRAIDRALQEQHAAVMAVLFTDIVGSTAYFEQRGDVEGLALVHRHNELLFPLVEAWRGRIVKTIGDAIMAVYDDVASAVASAVSMQQTLAADARAGHEAIRIRIGLHVGQVLKDRDDVFGDTVNVAARVNSACAPDEVLVTDAVVAALPEGHPFVTAPRPGVAAKGKAAPVPAFAVIWNDEVAGEEVARAGAERLFMLSVERGPMGLRVSAIDGDVGKGTVNRHVDLDTPVARLEALAEAVRVLCHDGGQVAYRDDVAACGRELAAAVLSTSVRKRLQQTGCRALRLHVDDTTVRVPFEVAMVPGPGGVEQPLGCAFAVGRVVSAPDVEGAAPTSEAGREVVVIADPAGDLPAAREEGELVAKLYESVGAPVRRLIGATTREAILDAVTDAAIVHLASHVERERFGIVATDGIVDGPALRRAFATRVPGLIVANACHASTAAPWATTTFTRALLDAGVSHVLAPLWSVPDKDALAFALRFTEGALAGLPVGEAVRRARVDVRAQSVGPLAWAGYVLFGDPRQLLPLPAHRLRGAGRTRSSDQPTIAASSSKPQPKPSSSPLMPVPRPPPSTGPLRPATMPPPASFSSSSPTPASSSSSPTLPLKAAASGVAVVAIGAIAIVALQRTPGATTTPPSPPPAAALPAASMAPPPAPVVVTDRTGPVRLSVLPFKGTLPGAPGVGEGVTEALVTDLSGASGIRLIERGQIDVDIAELDFQRTSHVDPATRAALGRIVGAEVVLLGAIGAAGDKARITARFVDVESGEVLATARVDGDARAIFGLQDALAAQVRTQLATVRARVRP